MIHLVLPDGRRERLRWTDRHPESHFGLGVVLRGHSGAVLDARSLLNLTQLGAYITCSTDLERRRVAGALAMLGMSPDVKAAIRVAP